MTMLYQAQVKMPAPSIQKTNIYFSATGVSKINRLKINDVLLENQMAPVKTMHFPFAIGANIQKQKIGGNAELAAMNILVKSNRPKVSYITGRLGVNYVLHEGKEMYVLVNANYAYTFAAAKVPYTESQSATISSRKKQVLEFNNGFHTVGPAICFGMLDGRQTILIKTGYDFGLVHSQWSSSSKSLTGFPYERFNRFYLSVAFTLGGLGL